MPGGVVPPAPQPSMTTQQFLVLGKVPDIMRDVKPFYVSPTELIDWLADVDSIFNVYREQWATSTQNSILERTVRRKIGEAAAILNANNIKCDWKEIKETLVLYYLDKRDIKTLDYELTSIKKSNHENISTYYSRVKELRSHIIVQVQTDDKMKSNAAVHIDYFRDKSLDAFIRWLERPLSILLKTTNPTLLGTAYQFWVEYYNMNIRSAVVYSPMFSNTGFNWMQRCEFDKTSISNSQRTTRSKHCGRQPRLCCVSGCDVDLEFVSRSRTVFQAAPPIWWRE